MRVHKTTMQQNIHERSFYDQNFTKKKKPRLSSGLVTNHWKFIVAVLTKRTIKKKINLPHKFEANAQMISEKKLKILIHLYCTNFPYILCAKYWFKGKE